MRNDQNMLSVSSGVSKEILEPLKSTNIMSTLFSFCQNNYTLKPELCLKIMDNIINERMILELHLKKHYISHLFFTVLASIEKKRELFLFRVLS